MRNRYVLVSLAFLVWVIFFDHSRLISQWQLERDIQKLEQKKLDLEVQIQEVMAARQEIDRNKEKFARENYFMKRPDEDVYIIEDQDTND